MKECSFWKRSLDGFQIIYGAETNDFPDMIKGRAARREKRGTRGMLPNLPDSNLHLENSEEVKNIIHQGDWKHMKQVL